ncbi:hypothetical protein [Streptomyces sp. SAS_276]|uniref:hypothetical protein n=1 Tax=Streptomyces sp. SAS_276 TaxID=3412745 RepID=UPI00403C63D8
MSEEKILLAWIDLLQATRLLLAAGRTGDASLQCRPISWMPKASLGDLAHGLLIACSAGG